MRCSSICDLTKGKGGNMSAEFIKKLKELSKAKILSTEITGTRFKKTSINWKEDSKVLAEHCSEFFDEWFDDKKYNYKQHSRYLAEYIPDKFNDWFKEDLFNFEDGVLALKKHCKKFIKNIDVKNKAYMDKFKLSKVYGIEDCIAEIKYDEGSLSIIAKNADSGNTPLVVFVLLYDELYPIPYVINKLSKTYKPKYGFMADRISPYITTEKLEKIIFDFLNLLLNAKDATEIKQIHLKFKTLEDNVND